MDLGWEGARWVLLNLIGNKKYRGGTTSLNEGFISGTTGLRGKLNPTNNNFSPSFV
jgi:hypothetical protein